MPLGWSAEWLAAWYRQPKPRLSIDQLQVAESVRLAISGDAGQRALMAWHLGWEPALKKSGRGWQIPILAGLLDDPYSAVRCVAERSLKVVGGNAPIGFEYSLGVESRPAVRDQIWDEWFRSLPSAERILLPPAAHLGEGDRKELDPIFLQLRAARVETPVRLRE